MTPQLSDLTTLARQAGEILRADYGKHHQIEYKGRINLVTEVDRQSETFLLDEIHRRFPGHEIFAEETGHTQGADGWCWYIDPLDGTTNFAHDYPLFAVSLALARHGQVVLAAVYNPMTHECYAAERGQGAWLNDERRLRVSDVDQLVNGLLATGVPYDVSADNYVSLYTYCRFSIRSQGVRRFGATSLALCDLAAGRLDGYWHYSTGSWDVAAGSLIAEEAGAVISNIDGTPLSLTPPCSIAAANPLLHPRMLAVFNEPRGKFEIN